MFSSKYRDKHYREVKYYEVNCSSCKQYFQVDLLSCETEGVDYSNRFWLVMYCPYCKAKNRTWW